ncbi:hypothetical protein FRC07_000024 [Ceratobasidium sp. 392]|nr:hypothetical protein FRC07_000024 [Ceratobasidium sp. 392]
MVATVDSPIIFYDIVGRDGGHWAVSPYKTRLTLNYKGLPYRVKWIKFEEVETTMKALGIAPTSKTFPHYTLPMIADPSSDPNGEPTYVSESFQIALYLDDKYSAPKYPAVLPAETRALQKLFIYNYLPTISGPMFPLVAPELPNRLDKAGQEYLYRSRGGEQKFTPLSDADVTQRIAEVREKWDGFAETLKLNDGPWLMGDTITFADFALGSTFYLWRTSDELWKEVAQWQDGKWASFWKQIEAIEKESTGLA